MLAVDYTWNIWGQDYEDSICSKPPYAIPHPARHEHVKHSVGEHRDVQLMSKPQMLCDIL